MEPSTTVEVLVANDTKQREAIAVAGFLAGYCGATRRSYATDLRLFSAWCREVIAHLGALDFIEERANVVFLGPPGTGKTHLSIALGIRACLAGHRVAFATAAEWVARLSAAHDAGRLHDELRRLGRIPLLVIDEVGYVPLEAEAANLFFQLVSARYERASVIMSSNKAFARWGETFGDDTVAAVLLG